MAETPIAERVAAAESEIRRGERDRIEMWSVINALRPLPSRMDSQDAALARIEALCVDKEKRISSIEDGQMLQTGERNALAKLGAGVLGICSVVGAVIAVLVNLPKWAGHQ
jgi:hypothetical protein